MDHGIALALLFAGCSLSYGTSFRCGPLADGGNLGICPAPLGCVSGVCQARGAGTGGGTTGGTTGGSTTGRRGGTTGTASPCADAGPFVAQNDGGIYVDDMLGEDLSCCGPSAHPCKSLGEAVGKIEDAGANGVVIEARHAGDGGDWSFDENFPIKLSRGVTLHAPGVNFSVATPAANVFVSLAATIQGDPGRPVGIGLTAQFGNVNSLATALVVQGPTRLQNAMLSAAPIRGIYAVDVQDGGALTLGPGPVQIGGTIPGLFGYTGLHCGGDGGPLYSSVSDVDAGGATVLTVLGQTDGGSFVKITPNSGNDILAQSGCRLTLTSAPTLGNPPQAGGGCTRVDGYGLVVSGGLADLVDFENGRIQCLNNDGATNLGTGQLTLKNTTIIGCECNGLLALTGSVDLEGCVVRDNQLGVTLQQSATVTVDGGEVVCNRRPTACSFAAPNGADLVNAGTRGLVTAANVVLDIDAGLVVYDGGPPYPNGAGAVAYRAHFDAGIHLINPIPYQGTCP